MVTGTLQSLLADFDPGLPLARARTIPNTWYTDPRVYEAEWGPLVWAHLDGPREPVGAFLDPLPGWVASRKAFDGLRFAKRKTYDVACNWKVYVDNYLDGGYHVNTVHPGLAGVLDYKEYRTEIAGRTSVQVSPLKPPDPGDDAAVGAVRTGTEAMYWFVFPNSMLNLSD